MGLFNPCNTTINSIVVFIILLIIIIIAKPGFMYDYKNNKFKEFGDGPDQTYFTLYVTSAIGAIVIYIIFATINNSSCSRRTKYLLKYS